MSGSELRFQVGTKYKAATSWKINKRKSEKTGLAEIYIFCRPLGDSIKVSLHASKQWHIAFASESTSKEHGFEKRFLKTWNEPEQINGIIPALRIITPISSVSTRQKSPHKKIKFIPSAKTDLATEIYILILKRNNCLIPKDFLLVDKLPLDEEREIGVYSKHAVPLLPKIKQNIDASLITKKSSTKDILMGNLRSVVIGESSLGELVLWDSLVKISFRIKIKLILSKIHKRDGGRGRRAK